MSTSPPARKLRVSPEAQADLQEVWDYLSQYSEATADRTVEAVAAAYLSLLDFPFKGRSRDELLPGLRSLVVGKYLIFYRVEAEFIVVARVLHGARDLNALFGGESEDDLTQ